MKLRVALSAVIPLLACTQPSAAETLPPEADRIPPAVLEDLTKLAEQERRPLADLIREELNRQRAAPIMDMIAADPENFGGVYLEQDGTVHILYIAGNPARERVARLIPHDVAVKWTEVNYSWATLEQAYYDLIAEANAGAPYTKVTIITEDNRVEVGL
jgi:hypothetical protein